MSDNGNALSAFRRGSDHDRARRDAAAPHQDAVVLDVDKILEERRREALDAATQVEQPASKESEPAEPVKQRVPAPAAAPTPATVPEPSSTAPAPADEDSVVAPGGVDASVRAPAPAAPRVRRPAVYNVSPEVVRAMRLLRVAREMDYPALITTAFNESAAKVPPAGDAVRKRSRFQGMQITVELDPAVKEAITAAATERNLNASAFVTAFMEAWIPRKVLRGGIDL